MKLSGTPVKLSRTPGEPFANPAFEPGSLPKASLEMIAGGRERPGFNVAPHWEQVGVICSWCQISLQIPFHPLGVEQNNKWPRSTGWPSHSVRELGDPLAKLTIPGGP